MGRADAAGFRVTIEMLVHPGADDASLSGLGLPGLLAALRPFHDRLVGPDGIRQPLCDGLPTRQRLSRMANRADLAAHRLLATEIRARGLDAPQPWSPRHAEGLAWPRRDRRRRLGRRGGSPPSPSRRRSVPPPRPPAALGERLFFETAPSMNGTQSCATCHDPARAFTDPRKGRAELAVSVGDDGESHDNRNTPTLAYASFSPEFHRTASGDWKGGQLREGRAANLRAQAGQPMLNPAEMAMPDKQTVAAKTDYPAEFGRHDAARADHRRGPRRGDRSGGVPAEPVRGASGLGAAIPAPWGPSTGWSGAAR